MASFLICPGQIKSGPTGWLAGLACLSCRGVWVSIDRSCGRRHLPQLAVLAVFPHNRTAPGDPFTFEKARAPTFQTRVLWGGWVRTYVVAGAVSWVAWDSSLAVRAAVEEGAHRYVFRYVLARRYVSTSKLLLLLPYRQSLNSWAVGCRERRSLTPPPGQFLLSPSCAGLITFARGLRLFFSFQHLPSSPLPKPKLAASCLIDRVLYLRLSVHLLDSPTDHPTTYQETISKMVSRKQPH